MKKLLLVLMFLPSICFGEVYYKISRHDFLSLCSSIAALKTDFVPKDKNLNDYYSSLFCEIDTDLSSIERVPDKSSFTDDVKDLKFVQSGLEGMQYNKDLKLDQKFSIIQGYIDLLEMKLLRLESQKKDK